MSDYVIITPAHNEEALIEKTIESMIQQTVRPLRWIIVNDASTDRTCEIVAEAARDHAFIKLLNTDRAAGRDFAKKVHAFGLGLEAVRDMSYGFIGNLDADISLGRNYYERILEAFEKDPKLGIAGGMVHSYVAGHFLSQKVSLDSVAGAVQLFRRACFEQIGGYTPLPYGGIDALAEIKARMNGWGTRTFPENTALEYRRTGSATARPLASRLKEGQRFYSLGYGCLFFAVRCFYRLMEPPIVLGSGAALIGFLRSAIRGAPVALPSNVVRFLRAEQRAKLRRTLRFSA